MSKTAPGLTTRWFHEWNHHQQAITEAMQKGKSLAKLNLPKTETHHLDLRGYSAPKEYTELKERAGKTTRYVSQSIRIKKQVFESADLSGADFEMCWFINCRFANCLFNDANFEETKFEGCEFENIHFTQTNFRHSSFSPSGILFIRRKKNFSNVIFGKSNLIHSYFARQGLENCQFIDCKTKEMTIDECNLKQVKFNGRVTDMFLENSVHSHTDMREAFIEGITLINQPIDGILFPEGDTYYIFKNKKEELARIDYSGLDEKTMRDIDIIKQVWLHRNLEADFVDINYLNPGEMESGKWLIRQLKAVNGE